MNRWDMKRRVMRRYDATARSYDEQYREEQEAKYKKALEHLTITGGSVILDVGCGTGLLFSHVAPKAQTVVGVEISSGLLVRAKKKAERLHNIHLVQADADHLPFKNDVFSVVFAFTVLQNMPKPNVTLGELKRVTKSDGTLVVTGLKKAFSLNDFMDMLEDAGLRVVSFVDDEVLKCYVAVARFLFA
ncbi:MAG: methyltransferase domain-containing protein [Candidatus Bathyarchaeota archaeon]|nr:methyltransferase domain-containing protein [Candidatus Bathyarchaeota archaeon]